MQRPFLQCSGEQGPNHDSNVCYKLGYGLHGQFKMLITNFSFGILRSIRFTRATRYTNVKEQAERLCCVCNLRARKYLDSRDIMQPWNRRIRSFKP